MEVLLKMDAPAAAHGEARSVKPQPQSAAPTIVRKSMVNYRRELHGYSDLLGRGFQVTTQLSSRKHYANSPIEEAICELNLQM